MRTFNPLKYPANILFIIDDLDVGGTERQILELVKRLDKDKFLPVVVCLNKTGFISNEIEKLGIKVIFEKKRFRYDFFIIPKLMKLMKQHNTLIVHTFLFTANTWGRVAARLQGVPVIISSERNVDIWKRSYHFFIDKVLSYFTTKIIVNADAVKRFITEKSKINANKIVVIKNGFDFDRLSYMPVRKKDTLNIDNDTALIGTVGRLEPAKGHKIFLEAATLISRKFPNAKFLIVGDGSLKQKLLSSAKKLNLNGNIIFSGGSKEPVSLISMMDIFVLPSLWEGLPNVLLEAMAIKKPIVATNVGGIPELIIDGKTGFLIEPNNPGALAEKILYLLDNKKLASRMAEASREYVVENFTIEKMVKNTIGLYDELLDEKLKTKIKIMLIIDNLASGGAQRQIIELLKGINRDKFHILVCSLSIDRNELAAEIKNLGFRVILINQSGKIHIPAILHLYHLIKQEKPDIVHTYLFGADSYGRLVARLAGVKKVVSSVRSVEAWKRKTHIWVDRIFALFTDKIVVNARAIEYVLRKRERINRKKIVTIYNGVDLERFKIDTKPEEIREKFGIPNYSRVVGIIGRLGAEKDHKTFFKAAKEITKVSPDTKFLVVGIGELEQELKQYCMDLGIFKNVIFAGLQPDIPKILKIIDISVLSSIYEGCSNVILESMAAGVPVVATNVGGNAELIEDGISGFIVESGDHIKLADSIKSLLNDNLLAQRIGQEARKMVERYFSNGLMVRRTQRLYKEMMGFVDRECPLCASQNITLIIEKGAIPDNEQVFNCSNCGIVFLGDYSENDKLDSTYWDNDVEEGIYTEERIEECFKKDFYNKLKVIKDLGYREKILDIGCGVGQFLDCARNSGWHAYGMDISENAVHFVREKLNLDARVGTIEKCDFPDGYFDVITLWDTLEHVQNPTQAIKAINIKLKKNGLLVIKTPNENSLFKRISRLVYELSLRKIHFLLKFVYYNPHYFSYTKEALKKFLENNGFKVIRVDLEETNREFALRKIKAHYKSFISKYSVCILLPLILFVARALGMQNKMIVYSVKV